MKIKKVASFLKKTNINFQERTYITKTFIAELINIYKKRNLYKKVQLSEKENKQIKSYWKEYHGKNIGTKWHRLYQSYTGQFQKKYFPEIIFSTQLELKLNERKIAAVLSDKSFLEIFYKNIPTVSLPKSFIINNSGIYYSGDRKLLTVDEVVSEIKDLGEVIVKTTLDASSGDAVKLCNFSEGIDKRSNKSIEEILKDFDKDFIIQEKIIPNEEFKKIYPHSINTLRVVTYIIEGNVYHAPVSFRVGQGGNFVDNIHAGGMVVGVEDSGKLKKYAFTEMQEKYQYHPDTNTVFNEYELPKVTEIIDVAKEMHKITPHMRMISWDFTVNHVNEIVLLEMNLSGQSVWFPQMVNGESMFGKNTSKMLQFIK